MFNQELIKKYGNVQQPIQLMRDVPYMEIIKALNNHFQDWTWELISDTVIADGTGNNVLTTVALYVPGRLLTGRSFCKVKDTADNHLRALYNASLSFIDKSDSGLNNAPQNNTAMPVQQMTADQVDALVNGNGKFINNAQDYANYTDNNNMPTDSIPFNAISEQGYQQTSGFNPMEQYNATQSNQQQYQQPQQQQYQQQYQQQPQYQPQPQQQSNQYSDAQINAMKKLKKDFGILNNDMLNNWVNDWHKGWTVANLNPSNIDDFISFSTQRGESVGESWG